MAKSIVLIGMMGCGKTTVGKLLAQHFGCTLVDTDAMIEERENRAISDIFAADGEAYFRALELELCRELGGRQDLVIACGGGLPMQDEAISALKENGVVFWLDRDPGETYYGLDISGRPLAQGGREDFLARYAVRSPIYHRWADFIIVKPETPQCAENRISTIYTEVSEA
jgi:shikimate kinase